MVHSHVRGANWYAWYRLSRSPGSSPRVWGKLFNLLKVCVFFPVHPHMRGANGGNAGDCVGGPRFIPTCVGLIGCMPAGKAPGSVHPHVRGVKPASFAWRFADVRFIPTCVGLISAEAARPPP